MAQIRRRSYDEGCIAAHALDLIGDRWALLVVRELLLGARRFSELRAGMPGISANILTQRLEEMAAAGLTRQEGRFYVLTKDGIALWPVLRALCRWGGGQPGHDPTLFMSPSAVMLSMRAMCARDRAVPLEVGFLLAGEQFHVSTAPGAYRVQRGEAAAQMRFEGATNALAATVYGPMPLAMTSKALIRFEGDPVQGQAFLDLFSLRVPQ